MGTNQVTPENPNPEDISIEIWHHDGQTYMSISGEYMNGGPYFSEGLHSMAEVAESYLQEDISGWVGFGAPVKDEDFQELDSDDESWHRGAPIVVPTGLDSVGGPTQLNIYYNAGRTYVVPCGEVMNGDVLWLAGLRRPSDILTNLLEGRKS